MLMQSTKVAGVAKTLLLAAAVCFGPNATATGQEMVAADEPAGYIVFPKVLVRTNSGDLPPADGIQVDTLIEISNTDDNDRRIHCFWVDATGRCGVDEDAVDFDSPLCLETSDCPRGLRCQPFWFQTDFDFVLTPNQTIGLRAGADRLLPCDGSILNNICTDGVTPCTVDADCPALPSGQAGSCGGVCVDPLDPSSQAGDYAAAPNDPFRGELKCVEVDDELVPLVGRNDLTGRATIYRVDDAPATAVATSSYNAVGIQIDPATTGADAGTGDLEDPMCLGCRASGGDNCPAGCVRRYAACPNILILDHLFDGAESPINQSVVRTHLTLVPCTEDLGGGDNQVPVGTTAQMLVFNEFEQRLSTRLSVVCYEERQLADIDTFPGTSDNNFSIFSAGVQGTLSGQTRIQGVRGAETNVGHGLLGVAEEIYGAEGVTTLVASAAYNLHHSDGQVAQGDRVCLSGDETATCVGGDSDGDDCTDDPSICTPGGGVCEAACSLN
jgi:hypothetical protein